MTCFSSSSCPDQGIYFADGFVPSIIIPSSCCDPATDGATVEFTVTGINNQSGPIYIDGTAGGCGTSSSPCIDPFSYPQPDNISIVSYTLGAIAVGDPFSVVISFTYPKCGSYADPNTFLNIYISSAGFETCCKLTVPISVDCSDRSPFTITPVGKVLDFDACVSECSTQTFSFTNDGCVSRHYVITKACTSIGMAITEETITVDPGNSSALLPVIYCPMETESGICTITITPMTIPDPLDIGGISFPCGDPQSITINYNGHYTYDCIDGVCTINDICSGKYASLEECQANCVPSTPPATLCLNCNYTIAINGVTQESTCDKICASVGQEVCVVKNIGFPTRAFTIMDVITRFDTFVIDGEWSGFNEGVTFVVTGSPAGCNDGTWTVLSSSYDPITNTTSIITNENITCSDIGGTITVTQNVDCPRNVHLNIVNSVSGEVIIDADVALVGNWAYVNYCFTISSFGDYVVTLSASDCFESYTCQHTIAGCQQYSITKTDCHKYLIQDNANPASGKIDTVTVSNLDGSYVATYTIDFSTSMSVEVTLPEDGVYTVTITDNLTSNSFQDVIFDLCDLLVCSKKLILDIFCNEKDPCCKECDQKRINAMKLQRAEVNKLIALTGTLLAYINRQKINYMGIFTIDQTRSLDLTMIMDIFTKINTITDRCGECKKAMPSATSSICKTC